MLLRDNWLELRALEPEDGVTVMALLTCLAAAGLYGFLAKVQEMGFDAWRHAAAQRKNDFWFAATEQASGRVIGVCAYQDIDYRNGRASLTMALEPGFDDGDKLLALLARAAFDHLRLEHVMLPCLAGDTRTAGFAERAGFTLDAIFRSRVKTNCQRYDIMVYTLLKGEGVTLP
jgi:RimJ/RimL family protein N-acetyltransferase